jgi:hypothetical protein
VADGPADSAALISVKLTEEEVERLAARAASQVVQLRAMYDEDPSLPTKVAIRSWSSILAKLRAAKEGRP